MIFTRCFSTPMDLHTVPLSSEYIKTPKMTVKTLKMANGSPNNDLSYMWPPSFPEIE
jgi:hypothetical protein